MLGGCHWKEVVNKDIPQLVLAQYHERYYPKARVVPNIIPIHSNAYAPAENADIKTLNIAYSPTTRTSAWYPRYTDHKTRWDTKGYPETIAALERFKHRMGEICPVEVMLLENLPVESCLAQRSACDISIDELITGSYHQVSLESLAQGLVTCAYLDERTQSILKELTGAHELPWVNTQLENLEVYLESFARDSRLLKSLKANSRQWVKQYYDDKNLVKHYVRAYEDLFENPESFKELRFNLGSKKTHFFLHGFHNLRFEYRESFYGKANKQLGVHALSEPEMIKLCAAGPQYSWLYRNKHKRIDANSELFLPQARNFRKNRYLFACGFAADKKVIDLGSGTGYGAQIILDQSQAKSVVGLDIDDLALEYAKNHHPEIEFNSPAAYASNQTHLADLIICFETIEHVEDEAAFIKDLQAMLNKSGELIISFPIQSHNFPDQNIPRCYTHYSIEKLLSPYFSIEKMYNQTDRKRAYLKNNLSCGIEEQIKENMDTGEYAIVHCIKK